MNIFNKVSITTALVASLALGFSGPSVAFAITATAPSLGAASTFSVLGGGLVAADGSGTTISGDLGYTTKTGAWTHTGGTDYVAGAAAGALSDATAAWTTMGSTGGTTWNPASDISPTPGLYTVVGDATFAGPTLTLSGSATDVWVFQINSSLTFTGNVVLTGGAQACNVYWRIASDATINSGGAGTKFVGTLIANGNVSTVGGATIDGRLMALTGTVSTAGVTSVTGPTCVTATAASSKQPATITVVKHIVNDGGGIKKISDFPLFVNGASVVSGVTNTFPAPALAYQVTEMVDPNYTRTFSGDCDLQGGVGLNPGDNKFCIVTNNDIVAPVAPLVPPLIDVIKVASPLSLPTGPGLVTYTYTLRNIGTVPVENITMVGDTCSPIVLISGDTNSDAKLDLNETWVHTCSKVISETHTNTVVATGWANGISTVDVAHATVVVGSSIVPPLIHVTKVPSPLALRAGGGIVAYTKTVTNPGTVALSNVRLTDDKCKAVRFVYGDMNGDSKLDPNETWVYTCSLMMTETTTNTVIAEGDANGMTARDIAIATVVVPAIPMLPNTGYAGTDNGLALPLFAVGMFMLVSVMVLRKRNA